MKEKDVERSEKIQNESCERLHQILKLRELNQMPNNTGPTQMELKQQEQLREEGPVLSEVGFKLTELFDQENSQELINSY
jgi:hypothetical protein